MLLSLCLVSLLCLLRADLSEQISCKNEEGQNVDWFMVYKIPKLQKQPKPLNTGFSYAYISGQTLDGKSEGTTKGWTLSKKFITDDSSIFAKTLKPVYKDDTSQDKFTYVLYNDQPPNEEGNTHWAHAKGVVIMDKTSGLWLIHSIPNFPTRFNESYVYPSSGEINGQTALCISFSTTKEGNDVADQLVTMRPNVYSIAITDDVAPKVPSLNTLITRKWPKVPSTKTEIESMMGQSFSSFSRSTKAEGDLYSEYMAPNIGAGLLVESWRRGSGNPLPSNCSSDFQVNNIEKVRLNFVDSSLKTTGDWDYIGDHSKWAVSESKSKPFACVGDINRMQSQFKRGGGSVCIKSLAVWKLWRDSAEQIQACPSRL